MSEQADPKKIAEKYVKKITSVLKKYIPSIINVFDETVTENDIFCCYQRYVEHMEKLINNIKIMGMSESIPLRSVFVRINILEKITAQIPVTPEALQKWEELLNKGERGHGLLQETKEGIDAIKEKPRIIVLGKPGAGKTTFLKYIALKTLDGEFKEDLIPVFISLKDWSNSKKSLLDFIIKQFKICQFKDAKPFVKLMLEKGRCLILLDGFDEVTEDVDGTIEKIKDFTNTHLNNQFVLSCRIAAWNYIFDNFIDVEIADFNDKQIKAFIDNWFREDEIKANLCWKGMQDKPQIKELANIPLLLTMMCLAFDETMKFPNNRSELYERAIEALLEKWDATRSVHRHDVYKYLSRNRKVELLSEVAYNTFVNGEYFIKQRNLETGIADYICHLPQTTEKSLDVDSKSALKSIESQHGLLVERALGIYSFSHLSLHEYFTSRHIVDNGNKKCLKQLDKIDIIDPRWKEIINLTAGMLRKANKFLLKIRKLISELSDEKLQTYLEDVEKTILSSENIPSSLCKLLAFITIYKSSDWKGDYDNLARNLARACDSNLDIDLELDLKRIQEMKDKSVSSLKSYLKGIETIVDCLNAECYLSKDVRKQLLERLLTEPWEFQPEMAATERSWIILESSEPQQDVEDENTIIIEIPGLSSEQKQMVLKRISAGTFVMGSPKSEKGRDDWESPQHPVTISNEFYMSKYPVTQAQWEAVMENNPSTFDRNPNHPVETVSWDDCQAFLGKINELDKGKFRLPSEAEWEYACRAGTNTRFYWGDDLDEKEIRKYAWYEMNIPIQTHEVGRKIPNALGLCDISGNVWEWCEDDWHDSYEKSPTDGSVWIDKPRGSSRVVRGGCWSSHASFCRSARRNWHGPVFRDDGLGFRVIFSRT